MLTIKKLEAMKRIRDEYREINRHPNPNIGLIVGLP